MTIEGEGQCDAKWTGDMARMTGWTGEMASTAPGRGARDPR